MLCFVLTTLAIGLSTESQTLLADMQHEAVDSMTAGIVDAMDAMDSAIFRYVLHVSSKIHQIITSSYLHSFALHRSNSSQPALKR